MSKPPVWAVNLVARLCAEAEAEVPTLTWRRGKTSDRSSGRYMTDEQRIIVTAGSDRTDQRHVLVHEVAHHLTPHHHHDETYWRAAWDLYRKLRITRYALRREPSYRVTAAKVAREVGIPGARGAIVRESLARGRYRRNRPRGTCPMPEADATKQGYRTPHTHYVDTIHRAHQADGSWIDYHTARKS